MYLAAQLHSLEKKAFNTRAVFCGTVQSHDNTVHYSPVKSKYMLEERIMPHLRDRTPLVLITGTSPGGLFSAYFSPSLNIFEKRQFFYLASSGNK
jgi:hypothetical protein